MREGCSVFYSLPLLVEEEEEEEEEDEDEEEEEDEDEDEDEEEESSSELPPVNQSQTSCGVRACTQSKCEGCATGGWC